MSARVKIGYNHGMLITKYGHNFEQNKKTQKRGMVYPTTVSAGVVLGSYENSFGRKSMFTYRVDENKTTPTDAFFIRRTTWKKIIQRTDKDMLTSFKSWTILEFVNKIFMPVQSY